MARTSHRSWEWFRGDVVETPDGLFGTVNAWSDDELLDPDGMVWVDYEYGGRSGPYRPEELKPGDPDRVVCAYCGEVTEPEDQHEDLSADGLFIAVYCGDCYQSDGSH